MTPFNQPADRQTPGTYKLNGKSLDLLKRSVCPKCDAWNNWEILGDEYTCKSCDGKYKYTGEKGFILNGDVINHEKKEGVESQPDYKILTAIDISNRRHWLNVYSKFGETGNFSKWNWPSFFFAGFRYLWKGIWKKGLMIIVISWIPLFLISLITENYIIISGIYVVTFLGISIYAGKYGSRDYYNFVKECKGDEIKAKKDLKIGRIFFFIFIVLSIIGEIL